MQTNEIDNDPELQRVLWACHDVWQRDSLSLDQKSICYAWVRGPYKRRFRTSFHQSKLRRMAKLGFLKQDDAVRGGHRRYYKLVDPKQVNDLLKKWGLN